MAAWVVSAGWLAFAGQHMVMSHPPIRSRLIEYFGSEDQFRSKYSQASMVVFGPLCLYYGLLGRKAVAFRNPSRFMNGTGALFKTSALFILSQMAGSTVPSAAPSPSDSSEPKEALRVAAEEVAHDPRGILRVTRHPAFSSFGLWGLGNALQAATVPGLIFWAGFPIFYLVGSWHQDYRQKSTLPKEYFEKTSLLPFMAIAQNRNSFSEFVKEINWNNASIAIGFGAVRVALRKMGRPFIFWKQR